MEVLVLVHLGITSFSELGIFRSVSAQPLRFRPGELLFVLLPRTGLEARGPAQAGGHPAGLPAALPFILTVAEDHDNSRRVLFLP